MREHGRSTELADATSHDVGADGPFVAVAPSARRATLTSTQPPSRRTPRSVPSPSGAFVVPVETKMRRDPRPWAAPRIRADDTPAGPPNVHLGRRPSGTSRSASACPRRRWPRTRSCPRWPAAAPRSRRPRRTCRRPTVTEVRADPGHARHQLDQLAGPHRHLELDPVGGDGDHRATRAARGGHPAGVIHQPERVAAEQRAVVVRVVRHDQLGQPHLGIPRDVLRHAADGIGPPRCTFTARCVHLRHVRIRQPDPAAGPGRRPSRA